MFLMKPEIDKEKCTGCGLCVEVCRENGITVIDRVVVAVDGVECDWCGICEAVCPEGAISCPFQIVFV